MRARHFEPRPAEVAGVTFTLSDGCRGAPRPPAGWAALVRRAAEVRGDVLDVAGMYGVPARAVPDGPVRVLDPSAAGLAAFRRDVGSEAGRLRASPGLPWDAAPSAWDHVFLAPPAERGNARVRAELAAAARALRPGGHAWVLLERDRGAKRYEREAVAAIGPGEVVARVKGFRLSRFRRSEAAASAPVAPWHRFDTPRGPAEALAGTFASGKLDPGSARLLQALDDASPPCEGAEVLDLGCGWGPLAGWAARRGGQVTACDDDLAAVRSTARNVPTARVLHDDLDGGLAPGARFDLVLVNPPFHLGAGVRVGLGEAMVATAVARLRPGGEAWLVANEALPYEAVATRLGCEVEETARSGGFKVWRARRRSDR